MESMEKLYALINDSPLEREALEELHGMVWDRKEVGEEFAILGFHPPFAVVRRQADSEVGTLLYQEMPRYYFRWKAKNESKKVQQKNNRSGRMIV